MLKKIDFHFKHLTLLSMLYTAILLISVLLDYKFISIGPMLASSATFVISITFFLSDVIAEVYGYQIAKRVVWSGVISLICFSSIGFILEKLPTPSEYAKYGNAYHIILSMLFRASISNSVAILIGAFLIGRLSTPVWARSQLTHLVLLYINPVRIIMRYNFLKKSEKCHATQKDGRNSCPKQCRRIS